MKIYLAGPMRGHRLFNFPAFFKAELRLRELGYDVVNPAARDMADGMDPSVTNTSDTFDLHAAFRFDFQAILDADLVVFLPGWLKSSGANAERVVAYHVGVPCYHYAGDEPEEEWSGFRGLREMAQVRPDISWVADSGWEPNSTEVR